MKRRVLLLLLFCLLGHGGGEIVWQLGKPNGSKYDFSIPYRAWEYGSAPWIRNAKTMDHASSTWWHVISENKAYSPVPIVNGLYSPSERIFMLPDEMVCNLSLQWNEDSAGLRRLTVNCCEWVNQHNAVDPIEIELPNGQCQLFELPEGDHGKKGPVTFDVVFQVSKGENQLVIKNRTMAKHTSITFDAITLRQTSSPVTLKRQLRLKTTGFSGIYHPGDKVTLEARLLNGDTGTLEGEVVDDSGAVVNTFRSEFAKGACTVSWIASGRDYYTIRARCGEEKASLPYAAVEPVVPEYIEASRFGCHALHGDGYHLRTWPEREELKMRRAFLGGAKWARLHSVKWDIREPEKGRFQWTDLDERLARAEKYKMNILMAIGAQPAWASTSNDKKLTVCGEYKYLYYPPKDYEDWRRFVTILAERYKGRVRHVEVTNEPGYTSAFWTCGDVQAWSKYLRVAYDALKSVDPAMVVYPGAPLQVDFLEEAVKLDGGKPAFDMLSAHYLGNQKRGSTLASSWKEMLVEMGKKPELINSEEMGWRGSTDARAIAENVVKQHVRDASQNIIRTFGFQMFDDNSNSRYSFFANEDYPLPAFPAYRAMTHRLEHATYVGDLSGPEYEAYLFNRKGTPVIVMWTDNACQATLPLKGKLNLVSMFDVERQLLLDASLPNFELTSSPQYLEGGDLNQLTLLAQCKSSLPKQCLLKPGQNFATRLSLPAGASLSISVPPGWQGTVRDGMVELSVPATAAFGVYESSFKLQVDGVDFSLPLLLEVSAGLNANLIVNGDFANGTQYWFYFPVNTPHVLDHGAGEDGSNAIKTTGPAHFGIAGSVKIRKGETYLLAYKARGEGKAGVMFSILDKDGNRLFPEKDGINALSISLDKNWKTAQTVFNVTQDEASEFKLSVLANYGDKTGKIAWFDKVVLARLTDNNSPWKILCKATFKTPGSTFAIDGNDDDWTNVKPFKIGDTNDGPATCQAMLDQTGLRLLVKVPDKTLLLPDGKPEEGWQKDSIQFGLDPRNDGQDCFEFIAEIHKGKPILYKMRNYWTPELPDNITRRGVVTDASIVIAEKNDGLWYELFVPIHQLHPLKGTESDIGFNILVNDDDGEGRTYCEWADGIGGQKNPRNYGTLSRE